MNYWEDPRNIWDEQRLRHECRKGTAALRKAYEAAGYIPTSPVPLPEPAPPPPPPPRQRIKLRFRSDKTSLPISCDLSEAKNMHDILRMVSLQHGLNPKDVASKNRRKKVVEARRQVCYECSTRFDKSLASIGRVLGIDHTSVMYHIRKYKACENKKSSSPGLPPSIPCGEYSEGVRSSLPEAEPGWRMPESVL